MPRPNVSRRIVLGLLFALLAGCAGVVPLRETGPTGSIVVTPIDLGGKMLAAHWYLPAREATALVVFEHGFTRRCANLRETTRRIMVAGLMALCVEASMGGGNPLLAETLARALADDRLAPEDRPTPRRIIVTGHSAGAAFAVAMGATLDAIAPERLAGALLFDPVDSDGFETGLRAISAAGQRPVLVMVAPPHRCNANSNAFPALRRIEREALDAGSSAFTLVRLSDDATHFDVEGENSTGIAEWACGPIVPANTETLRELAIRWAGSIAASHDGGKP